MNADFIKDIMECLVERRATGLGPEALADLFDRMIWIIDDNGEGILKVRASWLRGEDPLRVEIALLMDEVFPFDSRAEMVSWFFELGQRWPKLRSTCQRVLEQWDKQHG